MPGLNVFIRLTVLIAIFCLWMAPAVLSACPYRSGIPLATTTLNPIPIGAATDHSITGKPLLAMGDAPVPDGHEDKPRSTVTGIGGKGVAPHSKKWKNGQVSVAIDIGHSPQSNGARSARNRPEYDYNLKMATAVLGELNRSKRLRGFFINPSGEDITLARRAALIKEAAPGILVSIHHDSVRPEYLSKWEFRGSTAEYCDLFRGYSIFVSEKNGNPEASRLLSLRLGQKMREAGLLPTNHHAEPVAGESKQPIDPALGIYRYDQLVVLRETRCPALLLECGIIKNRSEEMLLRNRAYRLRIARTIRSALEAFIEEWSPR